MTIQPLELAALADALRAHTGPIVLYGAGLYGARTLAVLRRAGYVVSAFCDRDPQKIDTMYQGLPVISPQALASMPDTLTLLSVSTPYQGSVRQALGDLGIVPLDLQICLPDFSLDWLEPPVRPTTSVDSKPVDHPQDLVTILFTIQPGDPDPGPALERIAAQDDPHWQCLILPVGTGANDRLPSSLVGQDRRFRLEMCPSDTVAQARNLGLTHVNGGWVTFDWSGSLWEQGHLSKFRELAAGTDLAVCGYLPEGPNQATVRLAGQYNPLLNTDFAQITPHISVYQGREQIQKGLLDLLDTDTLSSVYNKFYRWDRMSQIEQAFDPELFTADGEILWNLGVISRLERFACIGFTGLRLVSDLQTHQYQMLRWELDQRIHTAIWETVSFLGPVSAKARRLLGELLLGRLALLVQNDLHLDCPLSVRELLSRWERILCQNLVGQAVIDADGGEMLLQHLRETLGQGLLLPALLSRNGEGLPDSGYLPSLLFAANWRQTSEALQAQAAAWGAPAWAVQTIQQPGGVNR